MFDPIFENLGTELVWQMLLTGFALIGAVVTAVMLVQRRAVPAAAVPAAAGFASILVVVLGRLALWGWFERAPDTLLLGVYTHAGARLIGVLTVAPVVAVTLTSAAFVGAREAPRQRRPAAAAAVGVVACLAVVGVGGWIEANALFAFTRVGMYALAGLVVVIALLCGGPEDGPGRRAGAGAAMVFPLVVAVGELSASAMAEFLMPSQLGNVPADRWSDAVDWMYLKVDREFVYSAGALAAATVVAMVGAALASATRDRAQAALGAVGWSGLAWALLWWGQMGPDRLKVLSVLATGVLD